MRGVQVLIEIEEAVRTKGHWVGKLSNTNIATLRANQVYVVKRLGESLVHVYGYYHAG